MFKIAFGAEGMIKDSRTLKCFKIHEDGKEGMFQSDTLILLNEFH